MISELITRIIVLRPAALVTIGLTSAAYLICALLLRKLNVRSSGNKIPALFVGLKGRSLLLLAVVWVKFAFFISVLLLAAPAERIHYLLLGCLLLFSLFLRLNKKMLVNELVGSTLLMAGLMICSLLLNYLRQIHDNISIRAAYWLVAVFLIFAAALVLLREVVCVSAERNYFDESGEIE